MIKYLLRLSVLIFSFSLYAQEKQPKVLLVLIDGVPADVLESTTTPNIDRIAKVGAYSRAYVGGERRSYSQTPTISAVSYTSLLTGTWVNKHNVWGNDLKAPNYNYWTIFKFLREAKPEKKLGIFSTWTDNRTKIIGDGLEQTNRIKLDYIADGYELDTKSFPHDKDSDYINKIDEEVTKQASNYIRQNSPDLSWVYLQYTDDMGHKYGDSEKMRVAVEKADRQIGDLYNAINYREQYFNEDWMIVIVTDHGRDVVSGQSHGGQSTRERTIWLVTNKSGLNKYFRAYSPAIVDVLPTVARHLKIPIPEENRLELDGIPLMGNVSVADPFVSLKGNLLNVEWTPMVGEGDVGLLIAKTNDFKTTGKADTYKEFGTYKLSKGRVEVVLPKEYADIKFLKVVLVGEHNAVNRWIVKE